MENRKVNIENVEVAFMKVERIRGLHNVLWNCPTTLIYEESFREGRLLKLKKSK